MRITLAESMCDVSHYVPLARAADQAGYHGFTIPDSICYPEVSDSKYPYTPDGNREFLDGKPFIEPLILAANLAAVTERLRLATFVVKLAVRNPVLVAKQIMSLAVMSDNRFSFGVGLSPWPEDFAVTGVPWEGRGRRMDEMIEIVRGLSTGDYYEFHGDHFDFQSIKMTPAPSEPIPILIGGHSDAAIRRAARVGDGWMHAGGPDEDLRKMIDRLKELRSEYDRSNEPFEIHVISMEGFTLDGLRRLEDGGVTDAVVGLRPGYEGDAMSLEEKLSAVHRFADEVISKL